MDKTFTLDQLPAWSPSAASLARITRSIDCIFGKLGPSASPLVALALAALLFCGLAVPTAMADFPPALVIDSVVYPAVPVSGTSGVVSYSSANGVLVLHGATGGVAGWGADESTALNTPSLSGTWHNDYSQPISLSGPDYVPTIIIPQVLVSYTWSDGYDYMQGYDGICQSAIGTGLDSAGRCIAAYNGLTDGYIFNFNNSNGMPYGIGAGVSPIYRYQANPAPMNLDTTNGCWPPSPTISAFPSVFVYNEATLHETSFGEGIANGVGGYWSNVFYEGTKSGSATPVYGEMHLYIAASGSTGQMWGFVDGAVVNAHWNPGTQMFVWGNVGSMAVSSGTASYGPPLLEYNGTTLRLKYQDIQGSDVYCDQQNQTLAIINSSYVTTVISGGGMWSGSYDPYAQRIYMGEVNIAAVSADGLTILGLPNAVTVITNSSNLSASIGGLYDPSMIYSLHRPDGTTVYKFACRNGYGCSVYFLMGFYWQFQDDHGASPIYQVFDANTVIDATGGWPANLTVTALPAQAFVDNAWLNTNLYTTGPMQTGQTLLNLDGVGTANIWNDFSYSSGDVVFGGGRVYTENYYSGSGLRMCVYNFSGTDMRYVMANEGLGQVIYGWNPNNDGWNLPPSLPDTITFSSHSPHYGPAQVSWNGTSARFSYTDINNGIDVYNTLTNGESAPFQVTIDSNSLVTVIGTQPNLSGTYNASTYQFNLNGGTLLAQDATGNLLGTASGLVIYSAAPWSGSVLLAGGNSSDGDYSTWGGAIYKFKRNDGSYGIKFLGIPQGSLFIVQNPDGTVSPYYRYSENSGDFILNTVAGEGFPSSSIWPRQLYVNGHYTALDASSEVVLNGGYTRQVSYHVQPGGETITVNWSGNSGAVVGSYGSYGSFLGTWDGGNLFGSLPNGLVITTSPPSYIARFGPPQIKWNGVELVFDPLASAVSASNPQGMDIYRDSLGLGLSARIGSNGAVTLYQADGSQLTGTYDSGTYQFNFGTQPAGSIQADSAQGFVLHSSSGRGTSGEPGTNNATMEAPGNFDVQGNVFSLGNWTNASGNSTPGLMLTFTSGSNNQASVLRFGAVRKTTDWVWSHADPDGSSSQITAMKLDSANRLQLFDPAVQTTGTTAKATIVLDPAVSGTSRLQGTVHVSGTMLIQPLGDIEMGSFTTGNAPQ